MKKLLLSSAIAAAMGVSAVAQAQPVVDEADFSVGYAINAISSTVTFEAGFGASLNTTRFVRLDITNGVFGSDIEGATGLTNADVGDLTGSAILNNATFPTAAGDDAHSATVVSGGTAGENFVIFEVETSGEAYSQTDTFDVSAILAKVAIGSKVSSVSVAYKQSETAGGAALEGAAGNDSTDVAFESVFDNSVTANDSIDNIDVIQNGTFFAASTGATSANLGTVVIGKSGDDVYGSLATSAADVFDDSRTTTFDADSGGTALAFADVVSDSKVTLTGDFSAAASILFNDGGDCVLDTAAGSTETSVTITQSIIDAGEIVVDLDTAASADGTHDGDICFIANGTDVISESDYSVTWNGTANTGYVDSSATGDLASLERNGSRAELNMLLDPASNFRNFVRITNPSNIDGRVFLELINDDGVSESFNLDDVTVGGVVQPASIVAGASTRLIPVSAIVEASGLVKVSDARNKFRLVVDGEFGETDKPSGVRLDNVTLATDNTTFSTF